MEFAHFSFHPWLGEEALVRQTALRKQTNNSWQSTLCITSFRLLEYTTYMLQGVQVHQEVQEQLVPQIIHTRRLNILNLKPRTLCSIGFGHTRGGVGGGNLQTGSWTFFWGLGIRLAQSLGFGFGGIGALREVACVPAASKSVAEQGSARPESAHPCVNPPSPLQKGVGCRPKHRES